MKTAVDFLIEEINGRGMGNISTPIQEHIIKVAKEQERYQIERAFIEGKLEIHKCLSSIPVIIDQKSAEQYYEENYGKI